jgi:hypothetical protein
MKKFEFTYLVKEVDIQNATVVVEYTPTNKKLTKLSYNIPIAIPDENGVVKPAMETVIAFAPHGVWEGQEILLSNTSILNSTGTVVPE